MSNGLLEVYVKSVNVVSGVETEYDTAVNMSHSSWTDTTYILHIDIYDGLTVELKTCNIVTSYSSLWQEDDYASHLSGCAAEKKHTIQAAAYNFEYSEYDFDYYASINLSCATLIEVVNTIDASSSRSVMVSIPKTEIYKLFNHAFKNYLTRRMNKWKRECGFCIPVCEY